MIKKSYYVLPILGLLSNSTCFASLPSEADQLAAIEAMFGPSGNPTIPATIVPAPRPSVVQETHPQDYTAFAGMSEDEQAAILAAMWDTPDTQETKPQVQPQNQEDMTFVGSNHQTMMSEEEQLAAIEAMFGPSGAKLQAEEEWPAPVPPQHTQNNNNSNNNGHNNNNAHVIAEQDANYQQAAITDRIAAIVRLRAEIVAQYAATGIEDLETELANREGRLAAFGGQNPRLQKDIETLKAQIQQVNLTLDPLETQLAALDQEKAILSAKIKNEQPKAPVRPESPKPTVETDEGEMLRNAIEESLKAQAAPKPLARPSASSDERSDIIARLESNRLAFEELSVKIRENERALKDNYSYNTIEHTLVIANNRLRERQDGLIAQNIELQERLDELNSRK